MSKWKIYLIIFVALILIVGLAQIIKTRHSIEDNLQQNQYQQGLLTKSEGQDPIFYENPQMNLTVTPEVAIIYGDGNAEQNLLLCNKLQQDVNNVNIAFRFNQVLNYARIYENVMENVVVAQYPIINHNVIGQYPNGSDILEEVITYEDVYEQRSIRHDRSSNVQVINHNNQIIYYIQADFQAGSCRDVDIIYRPASNDTSLKWDAYLWLGSVSNPTYSLLLDPNWVLQNSEFAIETFTGGMVDDGQNLSLSNEENGTAESVIFCPTGKKQNWSLVDLIVGNYNYSIENTAQSDMIYLLHFNESGTASLIDTVSGVGWTQHNGVSHSGSCLFQNKTNCYLGLGSDDYYSRDTADDNNLENTDLTIEAWIKAEAGDCGVGDECTIYSYTRGAGLDVLKFYFVEPTGNLGCKIEGTASAGGVSTYKINDGKWHYVVCEFGTLTDDIYVDGIKVFDGSSNNVLAAGVYDKNWIGNYVNADKGFLGNIEELVIRNRDLTQSEIDYQFKRGLANYNMTIRFGSSNATIVNMPYKSVTNGQKELNGSIQCIQYNFTGSNVNDSFKDPYLVSLNFTYSLSLDESGMESTLFYPEDNSIITENQTYFYANYTQQGYNMTNSTLYLWYDNSSLFDTNFSIIDSTLNSSNLSLGNIPVNSYNWNYLLCGDNDTATECDFSASNFTLNVGAGVNEMSYNSSTYETSREAFILNISSSIEPTSPYFYWNGTEYTASVSTSGEDYIISYSLDIPTTVKGDISFYYKYDIGTFTQQSNNYTQSIQPLLYGICNSTITVPFVNFTFIDETNSSSVTATVDTQFTYYLGRGLTSKSLSYSSSTAYNNYTFCLSPQNTTLYLNITQFLYRNLPTYPQRSYVEDMNLTNNTLQKTLYLLSVDNGIYTTFQILNSANQPIGDVSISAYRTINNVNTLLETKTSDASGSATFWVDPNYEYTFIFEKSGYDSYTFTTNPTQSSYTITLGEAQSETTSYNTGISYIVYPTQSVLNNNTNYDFGFDISSSYFSLDSYGFVLTNSSGYVMGSTSGTTDVGSNISLNINSGNGSKIYMNYYWVINDTYSNGSISWSVHSTYTGQFSLLYFFQDFKKFSKSGFNDFSRILLGVFIILIIVGFASFYGLIEQPLTILGMITALTFLFDENLGGLFPHIKVNPDALGLPIYVLMGVLLFAYIIYGHLK